MAKRPQGQRKNVDGSSMTTEERRMAKFTNGKPATVPKRTQDSLSSKKWK